MLKNKLTISNLIASWGRLSPQIRSVLRIVSAFVFMLAGTMKLLAFPVGIPPTGATVRILSEVGAAGVLELFGGFLILIGLFTRPTAFILSGEMAVAYFQVHFPRSFWPTISGGNDAMLFCFIWLYFSASGPGPWSLDAIRARHRSE